MNREINKIQKRIRAEVIKEYLQEAGLPLKVVCLTCGNASKQLSAIGVEVIEVTEAEHWWEYSEIQKYYGVFDATSGHLPFPLMEKISVRLSKQNITITPHEINLIATGSGETFVTMSLAYPHTRFKPVYNMDRATQYNAEAPLNELVRLLANENKRTWLDFVNVLNKK